MGWQEAKEERKYKQSQKGGSGASTAEKKVMA